MILATSKYSIKTLCMTMDKFPVLLLRANFSIPSLVVYSMWESHDNVGKVDDNYVHITTHVGTTGNNNLLSFFWRKTRKSLHQFLALLHISQCCERVQKSACICSGGKLINTPNSEEFFLDTAHFKRNSTYFTSLMPSCQTQTKHSS